jgi:predicted porin
MQKGSKDAFGAGLSVPIGSSTSVALSVSQKDKDKEAAFLAKYNLSKRTSVYFFSDYLDTQSKSTTSSTNSIGVQHKF